MKLARIEHVRCDEYGGSTLVWVDDGMTEEDLQAAVDRASARYLAAATEHMKEVKKTGPPHQPDWNFHRDRVIGEVLDEHERKKAEYKDWANGRRRALRGFDQYLEDEEGITGFWDNEAELNAEVDWGHRHGTPIEYGETKWPHFKLLKTVKRGKPGRPVVVISEEEEWA